MTNASWGPTAILASMAARITGFSHKQFRSYTTLQFPPGDTHPTAVW